MFWLKCKCSGVVTVFLDKVRVFRITCVCSGFGKGVLGIGAGVLD